MEALMRWSIEPSIRRW